MRKRRHRKHDPFDDLYDDLYEDNSGFYLDTRNKKIAGVCSGLANRFGWSHCTVRVLAVVGLIMMPQVVLPAYGVAYLVMDKDRRVTDVY